MRSLILLKCGDNIFQTACNQNTYLQVGMLITNFAEILEKIQFLINNVSKIMIINNQKKIKMLMMKMNPVKIMKFKSPEENRFAIN